MGSVGNSVREGAGKANITEKRPNISLTAKQQRAVELTRQRLLFDKGYAEIAADNFRGYGMSVEKMVSALNATDSNYTYEYRKEEEPGRVGTIKTKITHHRIYRKKK